MTKFQRFQQISSIIPFASSVFVFIVTMIELKQRKASAKSWALFVLTFFLSGIAVYFLNAFIMTGQHIILNIVVSGAVLAVANIICVEIQMKCAKQEKTEKTRKPRVAVIVGFVLSGVVVTAALAMSVIMLFIPSEHIEDTNGANTNLSDITMDDILTTTNNYSAYKSYISNKGPDTKVAGKLSEYDFETMTFGAEKISGIMTLHATKTDCDRLILKVESELELGNMEIIIAIDGDYYCHVSVDQTQMIKIDNVRDKLVVVKMAAESAKMRISVHRILE